MREEEEPSKRVDRLGMPEFYHCIPLQVSCATRRTKSPTLGAKWVLALGARIAHPLPPMRSASLLRVLTRQWFGLSQTQGVNQYS